MELNEWLSQMTGGDDAQAIAEHAGIPKRTVQHQIKTGRMSLENSIHGFQVTLWPGVLLLLLVREFARFAPFARFARFAGAVVFPAGKLRGRQAIMDPMIFLDDTETHLVAGSRRELLDALLERLPAKPELWQVQMIGAACLGHREPLAVVVQET